MASFKFISMRYLSLFLIFFGIGGTVVWPLAGLYLTNAIGGIESTLDFSVMELQGVQKALNDSYNEVDNLHRSAVNFEGQISNMVDVLNESALSIEEASENIEGISEMLTQASELWALRLLSPDFADTLKNTGDDLADLSQVVQKIGVQEFLMNLGLIEDVILAGIEIIEFLKGIFKTFSTIINVVILRIESLSQSLGTLKSISLILLVDAALIHLSLAFIGIVLRRNK